MKNEKIELRHCEIGNFDAEAPVSVSMVITKQFISGVEDIQDVIDSYTDKQEWEIVYPLLKDKSLPFGKNETNFNDGAREVLFELLKAKNGSIAEVITELENIISDQEAEYEYLCIILHWLRKIAASVD